jgi:hypothetical protein
LLFSGTCILSETSKHSSIWECNCRLSKCFKEVLNFELFMLHSSELFLPRRFGWSNLITWFGDFLGRFSWLYFRSYWTTFFSFYSVTTTLTSLFFGAFPVQTPIFSNLFQLIDNDFAKWNPSLFFI